MDFLHKVVTIAGNSGTFFVEHIRGAIVTAISTGFNTPSRIFVEPKMVEVVGIDLDKIKADHLKYYKNSNSTIPKLFGGRIGCDPEIFVEDGNGNNIPAFKFLPSKESPIVTDNRYNGSSGNKVYWDGFQAEFTTSPFQCLGWATDEVHHGLKAVLSAARKVNPQAKLTLQSTVEVDPTELRDGLDEHVEFGCMPSLNAYGMAGVGLPGREVPFRSSGGHLHFEMKNTPEGMKQIVKDLDKILGVASVALFANFDSPKRRLLYGLAGEYRLPSHGLEYRVLSSSWLSHPLVMNWIFDIARKVIDMSTLGLADLWECSESEVIRIINTCDVTSAKEVLKNNAKIFEKIIHSVYGKSFTYQDELSKLTSYVDNSRVIFEAFYNGMETAIKNPEDIIGNWRLLGGYTSHASGLDYNNSKIKLAAKKLV